MKFADLSLGESCDLAEETVLVAAAAEAGVFAAFSSGPRSAEDVAQALGLDERATRIVLRALADTGLLVEEGERFRASERCLEELSDPAAEGYRGRGLPHWLRGVQARTRLAEVLQRGGPLERRPSRRSGEQAARFTSAMAGAPEERIERVVRRCLERRPGARSVLDLGGGTGRLIRAFLRRGLTGTLLDTPDIVGHVVPAYGLDDVPGLEVVAADFTRDPLPSGPFDIVTLSNVVHIYGPEVVRDLFRRAAAILVPGGVLAVVEALEGWSPHAATLGVRMLLKSEHGDCYGAEEIRAWMTEAGLQRSEVEDVDGLRQLVTAERPMGGEGHEEES